MCTRKPTCVRYWAFSSPLSQAYPRLCDISRCFAVFPQISLPLWHLSPSIQLTQRGRVICDLVAFRSPCTVQARISCCMHWSDSIVSLVTEAWARTMPRRIMTWHYMYLCVMHLSLEGDLVSKKHDYPWTKGPKITLSSLPVLDHRMRVFLACYPSGPMIFSL